MYFKSWKIDTFLKMLIIHFNVLDPRKDAFLLLTHPDIKMAIVLDLFISWNLKNVRSGWMTPFLGAFLKRWKVGRDATDFSELWLNSYLKRHLVFWIPLPLPVTEFLGSQVVWQRHTHPLHVVLSWVVSVDWPLGKQWFYLKYYM